MSVTRVELKRKRYGEARKSAGSVTRRIASEIVLWGGVCEGGGHEGNEGERGTNENQDSLLITHSITYATYTA